AGIGRLGRPQRVLGAPARRQDLLPDRFRRALLLLRRTAVVFALLESGRALVERVRFGGLSLRARRRRLSRGCPARRARSPIIFFSAGASRAGLMRRASRRPGISFSIAGWPGIFAARLSPSTRC